MRLSFIDETWIKTNMTRLRGWCQKGLPLISSLAHGHWKTLTLIAALRVDGLTAPFVLDGPVNRMAFTAYVEHVLLPTLSPRDVVVMDNLNSHKGGEVRQLIRSAGAHLYFLPAYSPDLNPIEQAFAKIKGEIRKQDQRTIDGLWKCAGDIIQQIDPAECANYLRNAGYQSV